MIDLSNVLTLDKLVQIYLILKATDFLTGFMKAYKVEGFKSKKMKEGMLTFFAELVGIFFAGIVDIMFGLEILLVATKTIFIFKECVSITENLGILGIKLPDVLKDKIQDLNPDKDGENSENNRQ